MSGYVRMLFEDMPLNAKNYAAGLAVEWPIYRTKVNFPGKDAVFQDSILGPVLIVFDDGTMAKVASGAYSEWNPMKNWNDTAEVMRNQEVEIRYKDGLTTTQVSCAARRGLTTWAKSRIGPGTTMPIGREQEAICWAAVLCNAADQYVCYTPGWSEIDIPVECIPQSANTFILTAS